MAKVVLIRSYQPQQTLGRMAVYNGIINKPKYQCVTIELPYKENERNISCIPEGIYKCEKIVSPNFGRCINIRDVPRRDLIRVHPANFTHELRGCIAVGNSFKKIDKDNLWDIDFSRQTMDCLMEVLPDTFKLQIISL